MVERIAIEDMIRLSAEGGFDLIDVRSPSEFYEVHAVGALMKPLDRIVPAELMAARGTRKDELLYIICRSGGRSEQACRMFEAAGFSNVVSVSGGTEAWIAAGLPVNQGIRKGVPIDRQIRLASGFVVLAGSIGAVWCPWSLAIPAVTGLLMMWSGYTNSRFLARWFARLPWNSGAEGGGCGSCTTSCGS